MQDTPDFIAQKQYEIFMSKPLEERVLLNLDVSAWVWQMTFLRLKQAYPHLPDVEIRVLRFMEYYGKEFSTEQQTEISEKMRTYGDDERNTTAI